MFWAIGVILVNAYIVYRRVNLEAGVSKSNPLSHHDFRKQVVMEWIRPNIYWYTDMNGPALSTWKKIKSVVMASSSSVDGSASYVSKPRKIRTAKLDENVLKPDGELFMRLDTTKCHLADKEKVTQGVHCIVGWYLRPREVLLTVKLVMWIFSKLV